MTPMSNRLQTSGPGVGSAVANHEGGSFNGFFGVGAQIWIAIKSHSAPVCEPGLTGKLEHSQIRAVNGLRVKP